MTLLPVDLKLALRGLARSRALTVSAVLCLALGIGANATMLGVLDALLLRAPAHVEDAGTVQRLYVTNSFPGIGEVTGSSTSYPTWADLRGRVTTFAELGAWFNTTVSLDRGEGARQVTAALVTASFFPVLGTRPARGRLFSAAEADAVPRSFVALVSHELWQRRFAGAEDVLGRQLRIGRDLYTIIGVMPPEFTGVELERVDVWLPMNAAGQVVFPGWHESRGSAFLEIVGRLRPEVPPELAAREATAAYRQLHADAGEPRPESRVALGPIQRARGPGASHDVAVAAWLTGVSLVVLLIACANVAGLLLVRGLDRRRELAVRSALGAGRGQLVRLVLAESFVLAALGALAALALVAVGGPLVRSFLLPAGPATGGPDLRLLAILALLALGTALLAGVVPALWGNRGDLVEVIKSGGRAASPAHARLRSALVVAQVALTLVLLVGAGLFVRSLGNVRGLDLGLDADRVLVATVDLEGDGATEAAIDDFHRQALERVRHLPGIERASLAAGVPFASSFALGLAVPGRAELPRLSTGGPYVNAVTEGFFATLGTALRRGRAFTAGDRAGGAPVAVVNETMARLLWPGEDPLGRCLQVGGTEAPCATVVGVVEDARRSGLEEEPTMQLYVPLDQAPADLASRALFARADGDPAALIGPIRDAVQGLAPDLPFVEVRPLGELLEPEVRPWRMGATMFTLFGLLALALAVVGLAGAIAHAVARRRHELGVRFALGARRREVVWMIVGQGLAVALAGTAIGLAVVLTLGRAVQPLLFGVSAAEPAILAGASFALLAVALAASYLACRRVHRIDPAAVLRVE